MGNYTEREVKTSIRRLNAAINDIVSASYATYRSKIDSFVELTHSDLIIKSIVDPFRSIRVDFEEIHRSQHGDWISEVKLPLDLDSRIAYVIKVFDEVSAKNLPLHDLTHRIYKNKKLEYNIQMYLGDIAMPQLSELKHMLDDLIEDEVQGQQSIPESALQIINHGTIHAQQGSTIALGKDIGQTVNYKNCLSEIMDKVKESGELSEEKFPEVELLANEVQEEINKPTPTPSKLKELAHKVYDIGEKGLLKIFTTVVSDPRWGQAVAEVLINV